MKILVFLHGTVIMHEDENSILDYVSYVPVGNALEKLKGWQSQGAEILYLSSHENKEDLEKDKLVLTKYDFPEGKIYWRQISLLQSFEPVGGALCRPANSGIGAGYENWTRFSTLGRWHTTGVLTPHLTSFEVNNILSDFGIY